MVDPSLIAELLTAHCSLNCWLRPTSPIIRIILSPQHFFSTAGWRVPLHKRPLYSGDMILNYSLFLSFHVCFPKVGDSTTMHFSIVSPEFARPAPSAIHYPSQSLVVSAPQLILGGEWTTYRLKGFLAHYPLFDQLIARSSRRIQNGLPFFR